jgi:hypothetical protein
MLVEIFLPRRLSVAMVVPRDLVAVTLPAVVQVLVRQVLQEVRVEQVTDLMPEESQVLIHHQLQILM